MKTDPFADEYQSANVRWFWPADFDMPHDHPEAEHFTGWFYRSKGQYGSTLWQGPHATSSEAAEAAKAGGWPT